VQLHGISANGGGVDTNTFIAGEIGAAAPGVETGMPSIGRALAD
jgi:hypothetical protein